MSDVWPRQASKKWQRDMMSLYVSAKYPDSVWPLGRDTLKIQILSPGDGDLPTKGERMKVLLTNSSMRVFSCGTRGFDCGFDSKYSGVKKT